MPLYPGSTRVSSNSDRFCAAHHRPRRRVGPECPGSPMVRGSLFIFIQDRVGSCYCDHRPAHAGMARHGLDDHRPAHVGMAPRAQKKAPSRRVAGGGLFQSPRRHRVARCLMPFWGRCCGSRPGFPGQTPNPSLTREHTRYQPPWDQGCSPWYRPETLGPGRPFPLVVGSCLVPATRRDRHPGPRAFTA